MLEICVGTATNAILLAGHNPRNTIIGIDLSPDMLAVAQRKIERRELHNVHVCCMNATRLAWADECFDAAMVSFALHEMEPELVDGIVQEASRVLKRGGVLCVLDFARQASWWNRLFLRVGGLLEPSCFKPFLEIEWREFSHCYGFELQVAREYSFSNLYALRKL